MFSKDIKAKDKLINDLKNIFKTTGVFTDTKVESIKNMLKTDIYFKYSKDFSSLDYKNIVLEHTNNIMKKSNNKLYKKFIYTASFEDFIDSIDNPDVVNKTKDTWSIGKKVKLSNRYSSLSAVLVECSDDIGNSHTQNGEHNCDDYVETCLTCYDNLGKKYIKLLCSHKFHYDCIYNSYKFAKKPVCRQCPYCRGNGGWLPLPSGTEPKKNIHREFRRTRHKPVIFHSFRCKGILKSGMKKGLQCSHKAKYNGFCGKHQKQIITI